MYDEMSIGISEDESMQCGSCGQNMIEEDLVECNDCGFLVCPECSDVQDDMCQECYENYDLCEDCAIVQEMCTYCYRRCCCEDGKCSKEREKPSLFQRLEKGEITDIGLKYQ